jgi:hypothetical protein
MLLAAPFDIRAALFGLLFLPSTLRFFLTPLPEQSQTESRSKQSSLIIPGSVICFLMLQQDRSFQTKAIKQQNESL